MTGPDARVLGARCGGMSHGEDATYHANEDCLSWCTRHGVQPQSD